MIDTVVITLGILWVLLVGYSLIKGAIRKRFKYAVKQNINSTRICIHLIVGMSVLTGCVIIFSILEEKVTIEIGWVQTIVFASWLLASFNLYCLIIKSGTKLWIQYTDEEKSWMQIEKEKYKNTKTYKFIERNRILKSLLHNKKDSIEKVF